VPLVDQIMVFFAVTNGYLDDVAISKVNDFEKAFVRYMKDSHPSLVQTIATGRKMDDETQQSLRQAIQDFKATAAF
jgi:F-type H+-transporting ATPase subunit alpha